MMFAKKDLNIVGDIYEETVLQYNLELNDGETIPLDELMGLVRDASYFDSKKREAELIAVLNPQFGYGEACEILSTTRVTPESVSKAIGVRRKRLESKLERSHDRYLMKKELGASLGIVSKIAEKTGKCLFLGVGYSLLFTCALPSFVRLIQNKIEGPDGTFPDIDSIMGGSCLSILSSGMNMVIYSTISGSFDVKQLLIPLTTNIASGFYEWYRYEKKKK